MYDPVLPEDVIVSILTRLPVKSLVRFKCVYRPWLTLISSPEFTTLHRDRVTNNRGNLSFVIQGLSTETFDLEISLVYFNATEKPPFHLIPFPDIFIGWEFVGSIHGVVCLISDPRSRIIVLGNPALNQWKRIRPSKRKFGETDGKFSVGFGYDPVNDDYQIIRIAGYESPDEIYKPLSTVRAEVYSSNSDSWKEVRFNFPFGFEKDKNKLIVDGMPYWVGLISGAEYEQISDSSDNNKPSVGFIWYDVRNKVFKRVPWPRLDRQSNARSIEEYEGSLALLLTSRTKELNDYIDVLAYDEGEACWRLKYTRCPAPLGDDKFCLIQCSKAGVIFAVSSEEKLLIQDTTTGGHQQVVLF